MSVRLKVRDQMRFVNDADDSPLSVEHHDQSQRVLHEERDHLANRNVLFDGHDALLKRVAHREGTLVRRPPFGRRRAPGLSDRHHD